MMLLFSLACAAPKTPEPLETPPADVPRVPAPLADLYASAAATPSDAVVASAMKGRAWNESLSGAAGGLAMDLADPSMIDARWAGVRAGYPHPLVTLVVSTVPSGEVPTDMVDHLLATARPGDDVGLARARIKTQDRWVGILGRPRAVLQPFPRQLLAEQPLVIQADRPFSWQSVSPTGVLAGGDNRGPILFDEVGEWWLQLSEAERVLASFPVFVGIDTPPTPLVSVGSLPTGPEVAQDELRSSLNEVRTAFALPKFTTDQTLATLSDWPLQQLAEGTLDPDEGEGRLQAAGFVGGPVAQLNCQQPTIGLCVDTWMRSVPDRAKLLHPGLRLAGAAIEVQTDGLLVVLNLASE